MKLEQQVVSFEIAKQLKELKVRQRSLYFWVDCSSGDKNYGVKITPASNSNFERHCKNVYSAFTVAELGTFLKEWQVVTRMVGEEWGCMCINQFAHTPKSQYANTEANARGKCLLYLVKNGILSFKEDRK